MTQATIDVKARLMTSTLQTPYIYYTSVEEIGEQAQHALTAANGYFQENNPQKTLEYYQKAVNAHSNSSHLLSNLGSMQCALGHIQEGLRHWLGLHLDNLQSNPLRDRIHFYAQEPMHNNV